jgi:stage III sporulation protein AH
MTRSTYFIESRLERDKKRSEMISNLNEIINNSNTNQEIKAQAQAVKLNTVTNTEKELMIESMILAKGFSDVVVYLTEQSVNIVVQSDELTSADVAKIVDIVRRETQMPMDNIIIMNKN